MTYEYLVWGVNPEPWRSPGVPGKGRATKDGKQDAYQQALRDEIVEQNPNIGAFNFLEFAGAPLSVEFFFWRSSAHNKQVDATNIQKATEDALQGILYTNDKANRHVESTICEQTVDTYPAILIRVSVFDPGIIPELPPRPTVGKFEDDEWTPPEKELF